MDKIFEAVRLTKCYGNAKALDSVSISLEQGKIVGLLGPNGSGKTTLLRIAAGLLSRSSGQLLINGNEPGLMTKAIVSYLPDTNHLYNWMTVGEASNYYSDFFMDYDSKKAGELIERFGLKPEANITSLSKGMVEKLRLALALSRNARLYLLDEPLEGIDPLARTHTLDILLEQYQPERLFIISTQLVGELERIYDEVILLNRGKLVLHSEVEAMRRDKGKSLDLIFKEVYGQCCV